MHRLVLPSGLRCSSAAMSRHRAHRSMAKAWQRERERLMKWLASIDSNPPPVLPVTGLQDTVWVQLLKQQRKLGPDELSVIHAFIGDWHVAHFCSRFLRGLRCHLVYCPRLHHHMWRPQMRFGDFRNKKWLPRVWSRTEQRGGQICRHELRGRGNCWDGDACHRLHFL